MQKTPGRFCVGCMEKKSFDFWLLAADAFMMPKLPTPDGPASGLSGPLKPSAQARGEWLDRIDLCHGNPLTILLRTQAKLLSALGKQSNPPHPV